MAEESAFEFAESLFSEFREDNFFTPAFKTLSYDKETTTGDMFNGPVTTVETFSAVCQEMGGGAKQRAIATIDNIRATDIMIKGLVSEIEPPEIGKPFIFDGVELTAVNQMRDPTGATFTLFGRGS